MKRLRFCIPSILLMVACTSNIQRDISTQELYNHVAILASDEFKGRFPGDTGGIQSAEYIHQQLSDYGLTPIADDGYQNFEIVTSCELGSKNSLIMDGKLLTLETDYLPFGFSSLNNAKGGIEFAGYGFEIDSETLHWSDYANIDVDGKWVLILRDDPEPDQMMSEFISYSNDRLKVTLAHDKGAIGVLFVNGVNSSKMDQPRALSYDQNINNTKIPVLSITREIANKIIGTEGAIETIEAEIIQSKQPKAIDLKAELIEAQASVIKQKVTARNVIFKIEAQGTEHVNSAVVLGAHYDHLGMGGDNSRTPDTVAVHNGADDNASGVSAIIELAGYLQGKADTLQKDIVIVAFDAEEMGTLGSKYMVQNTPKGIDSISAMLNIDMIGRMKSDSAGITIGGTGTASEFDSLLLSVSTTFTKHFSADGYGPSDHAPFYSSNIPVLFFSTGAHEDYHTPFDDIEKLNMEKAKEIVDYVGEMTIYAATNTLSFQSTGSSKGSARKTRLKVTLGIIPDVAGVVKNGLGIDGVRKGGPGEKAGIRKGDAITAINGKAVGDIYEYMFRLSKLKPETTAIIEVNRKGETVVLLVNL